MARRARGRVAGAAATLLGVVALAAGTLPACGGGGGTGPQGAADAFLRAWSELDYVAMAKQSTNRTATLADELRALHEGALVTEARHDAGKTTTDGDRATVIVRHRFTSAGLGEWRATGALELRRRDGEWRVRWSPTAIDPALVPGNRLAVSVTWPERAAILGAGGAPLVGPAAMVRVGVQGSRITDPVALTDALRLTGASTATIEAALETARQNPSWFVRVAELPDARYQQLRPQLFPVPGTVFQTFGARQAVTNGLRRFLVGSVGPITAEILDRLGPPYGPTDNVGRSGIEGAYEAQLAGSPGGTVRILREDGVLVGTLASFDPTPGTPVQLTIDPNVQRAAEAALDTARGDAALVAIRASTGEVLASATKSGGEFDLALQGRYPPGSTFKIVTTAALLENGMVESTPLTCPATINVGGQVFRNFEGAAIPELTLFEAFRTSCNAAFIGAAQSLPAERFPAVAAKFGLGATLQLGVGAFGGSVPAPVSPTDQAATSIGQGKVEASPLAMASVAATVASGTWRAPRLVVGVPGDTAAPKPLDPKVVAALQAMTAAVVASGTASAAGLPPGTHGKTGTAEFGSGSPPPTHAWFVGYRGDVAVAVISVAGGVGGEVAAPIAARFLGALG